MASSKGSKAKAQSKPNAKKSSLPPSPPSPPSQWVVVQLTALGEREKNLQLIVRAAHQLLGRDDLDVFVPAINQKGLDDSLTTWYSEGYVFVQYQPGIAYNRLAETNFFSSVLSSMSVVDGERKRIYSLLTDKDLRHMRNGMQELKSTAGQFRAHQRVRIVKGTYKGLPGKVAFIYEDGEKVQVFIPLRSIKDTGGLLMDFKASYLQRDDT